MMKAAHKFTASREEFIGLALSVWRGCDPDDLPLEGGIEVGEKKMKRLTPLEVFTGVSGTAVALLGESPLPKRLYMTSDRRVTGSSPAGCATQAAYKQ